MKKFSSKWKASKRPGKQRKYRGNLPLHQRKKLVNANLSKELRAKYKKRSMSIKKGFTVKIMKGKFKKKQGKVSKVNLKKLQIIVEGIQIKKLDGSKANFPLRASNLQIVKLESDEVQKTEVRKEEVKNKKTKDKPEEKK